MNATHRRGWLLALLAAGALTVATGCTTTVEGSGTFAQGGGAGGGGGGEETSPPPSDPPSPGGGGDGGGSGGGGGGGDVSRDADAQASPVCQLFTDNELVDMFGGPVDLTVPYSDPSCQFRMRGSSTEYIDLTVYPDQNAHYIMADNATPITVAGHPGLQDVVTISVSLGNDIDEPGCVQGDNYFIENDPLGDTIDQAMVERAVNEFANG